MAPGIRSLLFVPGDDQRKLDSAARSTADALIVDLEDAVAEDRKDEARRTARAFVDAYDGDAEILVRINGTDTPWCADDVQALEGSRITAIMLPKATSVSLWALGTSIDLVALVETPLGVEQALEIARDSRVVRMMLGSADLARELGIPLRADEVELAYARSRLAMASAAAEKEGPIDVVYLGVSDEPGLRASAERGKALGFTGKACIHPRQVDVVNEIHSPARDEIDRARLIVEGFAAAREEGLRVATVAGRLVDLPVVLQAERLLARAEADSLRERN